MDDLCVADDEFSFEVGASMPLRGVLPDGESLKTDGNGEPLPFRIGNNKF